MSERQNQDLGYLIDSRFQGVNRLFVLSIENKAYWTRDTGYFLAKVEIKDNILIDVDNFFGSTSTKLYENIF